ncbi:MAG: hypothetical protein AB8F34_16715 [Akkermansiaceae bacterium]
MNDREKKLLVLLGVAAFVIINIFAFNIYQKGIKRMKATLNNDGKEIQEKTEALIKADENLDDWDWWIENQPAQGTHGGVGAELATYTERSAGRYGLQIKRRPSPLRENLSEPGIFSSAKVKVSTNGRDAEMYRWLTDLQDPQKFRSITRLVITPQRDDATRMDCELEISQWFEPLPDDAEVTDADTSE